MDGTVKERDSMKSYAEKNFSKTYLQNVDLQKIGVYYSIPVEDLTEEAIKDFCIDEGQEYTCISQCDIDNGDYIKDYYRLEYDFTDELEIKDTLNYLMKSDYNHYLVVLFNATWNNASGYAIKDDYMDCFYRDYDCSMSISGSSRNGKYLTLCESHHDKPFGHTTLIMGLTDREFEKLENMDVNEVIDFGREKLNKVISFSKKVIDF